MKRAYGAGLFGAVLAMAGCSSDPAADSWLLGIVVSTTGPLAPLGTSQLDAAALAAEEINAQGGVLDRPIRLMHRDDGGDPARARRVTDGIVADVGPIFFGAADSALTEVVAEAVTPNAIVLSASATDPDLETMDETHFCTCPSDVGQARVLAQRVSGAGVDRVAVIHRTGAGSWDLVFRPEVTSLGSSVTVLKTFTEGRSSYASLLTSVLDTSPQAIVLDANPVDGARIVLDYVTQFGGAGIRWFFASTLESDAFVTAVGTDNFNFPHEGVGPGTGAGPSHEHFEAAHLARYGFSPPPGSYAPNMYDAVYLAALALEITRRPDDPAALASALRNAAREGEIVRPGDWASMRALVSQSTDVQYQGASGTIDFDAEPPAFYDLWRVTPGGLTIFERRRPAP